MTFTLVPITLLAATWASVGAAQADESTSRSMTVSVASAGSSGAVPSVKELEEYVRGTVSVRAEKVAYDPTRWKGGEVSTELRLYVAETVDELNAEGAAKGAKDGVDPMSLSYEKTYETAKEQGPPPGPSNGATTMETKWWNGHIVVTGGFVKNYHFDSYATAQVQKWAGLGGGAGLSAGKAIAKRIGISAIPLIGQVLTLVAAGTAICTNSDGTMDIKMSDWPPVAYCNPFK